MHVMWYWVQKQGLSHPFKWVELATYDFGTQARTYETVGAMAMDDFGNLVKVITQ